MMPEPWEMPAIALSEGTCPLPDPAGGLCGVRLEAVRAFPPYRQAGICPRHRCRFSWSPSYEPETERSA